MKPSSGWRSDEVVKNRGGISLYFLLWICYDGFIVVAGERVEFLLRGGRDDEEG